jgi:DNA (cytosine-5)-methyltransferase 1
MKILNLYAGVGGNRKLWPAEHKVTAVEINPAIAAIYKDFFPDDDVIVGDAHQYLLDHYEEFDFIWSSPPCPTHSRTIMFPHIKKRFPDMQLYEEILFLKFFYKGNYLIENVISYYTPLIEPQRSPRHYFWANFYIPPTGIGDKVRNDAGYTLKFKMDRIDFNIKNWHGYKGDKRQILNNMIEPELGLHVFEASLKAKVVQAELL